jgi:hypothetical protein
MRYIFHLYLKISNISAPNMIHLCFRIYTFLCRKDFPLCSQISLPNQIDSTISSLHHKYFTVLQRNRRIKFVSNLRANEVQFRLIQHNRNIFSIFVDFWKDFSIWAITKFCQRNKTKVGNWMQQIWHGIEDQKSDWTTNPSMRKH